jgi:hypothetical protein
MYLKAVYRLSVSSGALQPGTFNTGFDRAEWLLERCCNACSVGTVAGTVVEQTWNGCGTDMEQLWNANGTALVNLLHPTLDSKHGEEKVITITPGMCTGVPAALASECFITLVLSMWMNSLQLLR